MLNGYKTYIGIGIAALGALSSIFGWGLGDLAGVEDALITLVGSVLAAIGRATVQTK